jgi:2-keto-4-pentenoate hydratase/2-oxohepta-3-ene-1,7-dioic acid hydratase in catechol pathway
MRLIAFQENGRAVLGVRRNDLVVNLSLVAPDLPATLAGLLVAGRSALETAAARAAAAPASATRPLETLRYLPPAPHPGKILCLGLNYAAHAAEKGAARPASPQIFCRWATTLVGHQAPLLRPRCSTQLDYEGELAVIVGAMGRHVARKDALSLVGGYAVFNDASVRDFQFQTTQWTMGKNFDGTGGFGPECVTPEELPPGAAGLRLRTRLNGQVMQDADTKAMLFDVAETLAFITQAMTLHPGDVIVMGTPAGVGWVRKPPVFMKAGDVCEVEIEGIGILRNPIQDE